MILLSALLAAGVVQGPEPIDPARWVDDSDYPKESLRQGVGGVTSFRLIISETGQPERCEVVESSGLEALDQRACAIMLKRGRFQPGKDETGKSSASVYRSQLTWRPASRGKLKPIAPDLELLVSSLPPGLQNDALVRVNVVITSTGQVRACSPRAQSASSKEGKDVLGEVACGQALTLTGTPPVLDQRGAPIDTVQTLLVGFRSDAP